MAVSILRTRRAWGAVLVLVGVAALAGWSSQQQVQAQGRRTVWDKIYTAEQAAKGKTDYETSCSGCHGITLEGGRGRPLNGNAFITKWDFQSVNQLYNEIKTRMPRDQPGSLTADAYLGIVTYILQTNKFPAGDTPLAADNKLASTFITRSATATAKSAEAITTGTLVQVVGCLDGAAGAWKLTKTTEPVRTETPDASSAEELKQLASAAAGSGSFTLLGIYAPMDEHKGHRMEAKGFIVKDPDGDRVNVVSLEPVATSCQ
jgi:mono/diheme cytochrome c family protein